MTLSNITSVSAGEASVSSGSHTDHEYDGNDTSTPPPPRSMTSTPATTVSSGQQQQPPLAAAGSKRKRNLPGTPGMYGFVLAVLFLHGLWFLFGFLVVHSWRFSGSVFEEEENEGGEKWVVVVFEEEEEENKGGEKCVVGCF